MVYILKANKILIDLEEDHEWEILLFHNMQVNCWKVKIIIIVYLLKHFLKYLCREEPKKNEVGHIFIQDSFLTQNVIYFHVNILLTMFQLPVFVHCTICETKIPVANNNIHFATERVHFNCVFLQIFSRNQNSPPPFLSPKIAQ